MPVSTGRDQVIDLIAEGAQLVEALPADEYDEEHLPGAIHLPIKSLSVDATSVLDMARPVIVYCWDGL